MRCFSLILSVRRMSPPRVASVSLLLFFTISFLLWSSPSVRLKLVRVADGQRPPGTGRGLNEAHNGASVGSDQNSSADSKKSRSSNPQISNGAQPANPHDFPYLISETCVCRLGNSTHPKFPFLITFVHSSPDHFDVRLAIRNTWGNSTIFPDTRIIFVMGETPNRDIQNKLEAEARRFHDIVQENFHDSYRNLTYKAIAGLKWVTNNCRGAKYVLKIDDDIFVNTFSLLKHLRNIDRYGVGKSKLVLCLLWIRMKVMRDKKSKWYVPPSEFAEDYFPPYCSGSAYIMSTDIVEKMYTISFDTKFFWVDDFYITGLLAGKAGANYQKFNSVYVIASNQVMNKFTGPKAETTIFGHVTKSKDIMYILWEKVVQRMTGKKLPSNWKTL